MGGLNFELRQSWKTGLEKQDCGPDSIWCGGDALLSIDPQPVPLLKCSLWPMHLTPVILPVGSFVRLRHPPVRCVGRAKLSTPLAYRHASTLRLACCLGFIAHTL